MATLDLNKKLWRIPQRGKVGGVCAGIAQYLDIRVKIVRILTILAMCFGLFFIVVAAYIVLFFVLDPLPENYVEGEAVPSCSELLDAVDAQLAAGEARLRQMERYVTSDTFSLRSRFRQL
ncbi:envelope stress response membrane protein PspC [Kosakonia sp. ML.JS2a]|uniref:envelope stress response membrane protein PspC n=1 Tax=Kosakonia sp. ML.JS2a TaxID=2980557 RepID=UPI0021DAF7A9|nr:envelope stress response membrane protein PspC [Kosakonia sp. ML.JS2a]UXY13154.1 envelope stress response membrane protein PspC [Kosakonia sp. ML.JS2a]